MSIYLAWIRWYIDPLFWGAVVLVLLILTLALTAPWGIAAAVLAALQMRFTWQRRRTELRWYRETQRHRSLLWRRLSALDEISGCTCADMLYDSLIDSAAR